MLWATSLQLAVACMHGALRERSTWRRACNVLAINCTKFYTVYSSLCMHSMHNSSIPGAQRMMWGTIQG